MKTDNILKQILNEEDFSKSLVAFIRSNNMSINDFCLKYKIPLNTFYKIISASRKDFRVSTLKRIFKALKDIEGEEKKFIAIIAPRLTIDSLEENELKIDGVVYKIKGYYVENIIDLVAKSMKAEKDGASGIICGPLAAEAIKDTIDIPISSLTDSALDVAISNIKIKLKK